MAAGEPTQGVLERLYRQHMAELRAVLARLAGPGLSADDLLHEVFMITHAKLDQFEAGGPPAAWLFGVAAKVALGARRKAALHRFLGLDDAPEPAAHGTPESHFEHAEAARRVYAALDRIEARKRTVFVLYELQGLRGEEIAQALQIPLKTVWTRLGRARVEFAEKMRRADGRAHEHEERIHERT